MGTDPAKYENKEKEKGLCKIINKGAYTHMT